MDIFGGQTDIGRTSRATGLPSVKRQEDFGNIFGLDDKRAVKSSVKLESEIASSASSKRSDRKVVKPEIDERSDEYGDIFGVEEKPDETAEKQQSEEEEASLEKQESELVTDDTAKVLNNEKSGKENLEDQSKENEDGLEKRSRKNDRRVKGIPRVDPFMFRAMDVSEPESEDEKNYPAIYDNELNSLDDKPWREADADITDWFNYGFDEDSWRTYCAAQVKMRLTLSKRKEARLRADDKKFKSTNTPGVVKPKSEERGSPSKDRVLGKPTLPNAWNRLSDRGICFDFSYKGYCSRASCKWLHTQRQQDVRKPPPIPTKIPVPPPLPPVVGVPVGATPGFRPSPLNPVTGSADVQNFMEQLRPVSSLVHPSIIGRVHSSRDKKRKRSRRSRSRSRTRR